MFYVAMGLVEDRQIAEDAVQESFINLWAHREQINPDYDLQYYLNQSVRNYIYKYFRHCRVREKHAEALIREYKFWADYKSEDLAEKVENVREYRKTAGKFLSWLLLRGLVMQKPHRN